MGAITPGNAASAGREPPFSVEKSHEPAGFDEFVAADREPGHLILILPAKFHLPMLVEMGDVEGFLWAEATQHDGKAGNGGTGERYCIVEGGEAEGVELAERRAICRERGLRLRDMEDAESGRERDSPLRRPAENGIPERGLARGARRGMFRPVAKKTGARV